MKTEISIENLMGGAVLESVNVEMEKVLRDIADFSKDPESKRTLVLKLHFVPNENATSGSIVAEVTSTLGKQKTRSGFAYFGLKDGKGVATSVIQPVLPQFVTKEDDDDEEFRSI